MFHETKPPFSSMLTVFTIWCQRGFGQQVLVMASPNNGIQLSAQNPAIASQSCYRCAIIAGLFTRINQR